MKYRIVPRSRLIAMLPFIALALVCMLIACSKAPVPAQGQPGQAATPSDALARKNPADKYANGTGVPKDDAKTAEQGIDRAQEPDLEKIKADAAKGDAEAEFQLGKAYANGTGVPHDFVKAAELYQKAADQGNAKAQNNLAMLYEHGQGVARDDAEALKWYRKSAEQGAAFAQESLGRMLLLGRGGPKNFKEAAVWLRKAADQNQPNSEFLLGQIYYNGNKDVPRDYKEAAKWFAKAAQQGNGMAQANLGNMYFMGFGVQRDMPSAYQWLTLAVSHRVPMAGIILAKIKPGMTPEEIAKGDSLVKQYNAAQQAAQDAAMKSQ